MADNTSSTNNSTRTEEDLLGTMEISNDHYYGIHTQRAIDNYQISGVTVNSQPNFIRGMVYTLSLIHISEPTRPY